ncbi:MAG: tetratricopeptide repeat protein [Bacteroidota bacterium]
MRLTGFLIVLGWLAALGPAASHGREGNEHLAAEDAPAAEQSFVAGLAEDEAPPEIGAALWNNLGLARLAQNRAAEADSAFARVLPLAATPEDRALASYNRGTAALTAGDIPSAIRSLRRALVLRPTYVPAQVNLEIALRRQQTGDQETPEEPEPSPFAERLKAEADSLVEARRYTDAFGLMQDGLARDSTIAAFGEFIQRLGQIVEVDSDPSP